MMDGSREVDIHSKCALECFSGRRGAGLACLYEAVRAVKVVLEEHSCRKTMQAFRQPRRRCAMIGPGKKFVASTGSRYPIFSTQRSRRIGNSTIPRASNSAAC